MVSGTYRSVSHSTVCTCFVFRYAEVLNASECGVVYSEQFDGVTKWLVFLLCNWALYEVEEKKIGNSSAFYSEIVYFCSIILQRWTVFRD